MRISRSTGYALLAVGYMAKNRDKTITLSNTISEAYNIPLEYLLKILQQLVRANVLRSKRGPRGGFSLSKPADKTTMLEIIEAVEGPTVGQLELMEQSPNDIFCIKADKAYQKAIAQEKSVYENTKLSDML
jgi:Rrf2 family protein